MVHSAARVHATIVAVASSPPATASHAGTSSALAVSTPHSACVTPPRVSRASAFVNSRTDNTPQHVHLHGHPATWVPTLACTQLRPHPAAHVHLHAPASTCTPAVLAHSRTHVQLTLAAIPQPVHLAPCAHPAPAPNPAHLALIPSLHPHTQLQLLSTHPTQTPSPCAPSSSLTM